MNRAAEKDERGAMETIMSVGKRNITQITRSEDDAPKTFRPLAAVGSVVFLAAAYSCTVPWWVASLGIAAFASAILRTTAFASARAGLVLGTLVSGVALYWLPSGLSRASGCPVGLAYALTLLAAPIYGARFGVAAWAEHRVTNKGWPEGVGLVLGFAAGEIAVPGPLPWYLGACAHGSPVLLQVSELSGPIAVSTVLVAGGATVRTALRAARVRRSHGRGALGVPASPNPTINQAALSSAHSIFSTTARVA